MNRIPFYLVVLILLASCATQQNALRVPDESSPIQTEPSEIPKERLPVDRVEPPVEDFHYPAHHAPTIQCREDTLESFNPSGIEALPFLKAAFHDMDGDGIADMIAGSKDGLLRLYRSAKDPRRNRWEEEKGYFRGVRAGAFSSPAAGDLDGDGMAEIAVGTGGFSSDSGRVMFFRNLGTKREPVWSEIPGVSVAVGNDASVAVVDYDFDGRADIIAGNSEGKIFFFRNVTRDGTIRFAKDKPFLKRSFGMYAVPAAVRIGDRVFLAVGNDRGKIVMFEIRRNEKGMAARETGAKLSSKPFASPAFADLLEKGRYDFVVADGDGSIAYFENRRRDFSMWEEDRTIFHNRLFAGPACAPSVCFLADRTFLVVGNIDGTLRLFEFLPAREGLPWVERENYLKGIKVPGFARGILTLWEGREIVITGQSDGKIRVFEKSGTEPRHEWKEKKGFFGGVSVGQHSTPAIFDFDGDGRWELITGSEDGKVNAFKVKEVRNGLPLWERMKGVFDTIRVDGFSTPAAARDGGRLFLFVGQQDGKIRTFTAESGTLDHTVFRETAYLGDLRMKDHSSPFIWVNGGVLRVVSGDYDGNIRYFTCTEGT